MDTKEIKCPLCDIELKPNYHLPCVYACPKCFEEYIKDIKGEITKRQEFMEKKENFNG